MEIKKITVKTKDGTNVKTKIFDVEGTPVGVVIISHGFGEYIDMYDPFIENLTKANYACVIFDQRGHGEDSNVAKTQGEIPGYEYFLDDIDAIRAKMDELYPQVPVILYGHSMGGNIVASYLINRNQAAFAGAVLETPWLRLYKPMPKVLEGLAKVLGDISSKFAKVNELRRHEVVRPLAGHKTITDFPHYHNRISFRLFAGVTKAGEYAIANAKKITIPTMLICANNDMVVCPEAIKEFGANANSNVELKVYDDAYHAIHADLASVRYIPDLIEFLNKL